MLIRARVNPLNRDVLIEPIISLLYHLIETCITCIYTDSLAMFDVARGGWCHTCSHVCSQAECGGRGWGRECERECTNGSERCCWRGLVSAFVVGTSPTCWSENCDFLQLRLPLTMFSGQDGEVGGVINFSTVEGVVAGLDIDRSTATTLS